MTKEKKSTSKKTSKDKTVKVNKNQFDLIIDFGPAHKAEEEREIELALQQLENELQMEAQKAKAINTPWYKKLSKAFSNWFNR